MKRHKRDRGTETEGNTQAREEREKKEGEKEWERKGEEKGRGRGRGKGNGGVRVYSPFCSALVVLFLQSCDGSPILAALPCPGSCLRSLVMEVLF